MYYLSLRQITLEGDRNCVIPQVLDVWCMGIGKYDISNTYFVLPRKLLKYKNLVPMLQYGNVNNLEKKYSVKKL